MQVGFIFESGIYSPYGETQTKWPSIDGLLPPLDKYCIVFDEKGFIVPIVVRIANYLLPDNWAVVIYRLFPSYYKTSCSVCHWNNLQIYIFVPTHSVLRSPCQRKRWRLQLRISLEQSEIQGSIRGLGVRNVFNHVSIELWIIV